MISMGPPQAMAVIREAFAMGVDRGALCDQFMLLISNRLQGCTDHNKTNDLSGFISHCMKCTFLNIFISLMGCDIWFCPI